MPSTYSPLKVELMSTGENSGTWGTVTNSNLGTVLEEAIVGLATANFPSNADLTLTLTDSVATQVARHFVLNVTSSVSLTTTRNLVVPSIEKPYLVINGTTGGQSIIVKNSTGSGITIPNGSKTFVYNNGTNVISTIDYLPALALSAALPVSSGGTGATTLTGIVKGTGTSALTAGTVALGSEVSGTLPVASGGTGITSFGTGVATALGQNVTGSGGIVLAASPSLTTPVLGTPTSGALTNCTADGTNAVGYRNIPAVADKTGSYSLLTSDIGKVVGVGSGGSITIPDSTFAAGDAVLLFNNTSGSVTVTCSITTAYIAGVDLDKNSVTLATRGIANILFLSGTSCVITGNVS